MEADFECWKSSFWSEIERGKTGAKKEEMKEPRAKESSTCCKGDNSCNKERRCKTGQDQPDTDQVL